MNSSTLDLETGSLDTPDADYLNNPQAYVIEKKIVTSADVIDATMAPGGGFAVSFIHN